MTQGGYYSGEGQDIDLDKYRELMREYNANPNALRPRTVRNIESSWKEQCKRHVMRTTHVTRHVMQTTHVMRTTHAI